MNSNTSLDLMLAVLLGSFATLLALAAIGTVAVGAYKLFQVFA